MGFGVGFKEKPFVLGFHWCKCDVCAQLYRERFCSLKVLIIANIEKNKNLFSN